MVPSLLTIELANARQADLRRDAARTRRTGGPNSRNGVFASFVDRVRHDLRRVQLGPTEAVPCLC